MNKKALQVSNKYAQAFYNEYGKGFSEQDFWHIKDTAEFLTKNNSCLSYFDWCEPANMSTLINKFLERFNLPTSFSKLLLLLRKQKRVLLLPSILHCILDLYLKKENKLFFELQSYPKLSSSQEDTVTKFLATKTNKEILYKCLENKNLISGIKAQGSGFLYEDSIQHKMQIILKSLVRQN